MNTLISHPSASPLRTNQLRINCLPEDIRCHTLSFLTVEDLLNWPESDQCVTNALNQWTIPSESPTFLNRVRSSALELYGKIVKISDDKSYSEAVCKRIKLIKQIASKMLQKAAPLLSEQERQAIGFDDLSEFSSNENLDKMGALISNRRAENLISFFNTLCVLDEARQFRDELPDPLSNREKVKKIREWMTNHLHLFQHITEIDVTALFPQNDCTQGIPIEILLLPNLNTVTLGRIFISVSYSGNLEVAEALSKCRQFSQIPIQFLEFAFLDTVQKNHSKIVNIIVNSGRFNEILDYNIGLALRYAVRLKNLKIVNILIQSTRFGDISPSSLGFAFLAAVQVEDPEIVNALIHSGRFSDILIDDLNEAFSTASQNQTSDIICAIMQSERFREIPIDRLGSAYCAAQFKGYSNIVQAIKSSTRFDEIPQCYLNAFDQIY